MAVSIKKNFLYSCLLTAANYIFPFITYPYVSRVLGVTNIGICNFVDSIINYYVLFAMMGIGVVGIREIASNKNDREKLNQTFNSLFLLNFVTTSIMLIGLIASIYLVPKLYEHRELMWFGALKLVFNYLLINWFYQGMEEFRYITLRSVAIKTLYVVGVFVFVHEQADYPIYYFLLVMMTVLNAVVNIAYSRKFVKLKVSGISITKYLKPFLTYGLYTLLISMYTSFNVAYLGFAAGETQVGYYTTATKICGILMALYTAFTNVMLPRMSSLVSEGEIDGFKVLLRRSFNCLVAFAIPIVIYTVAFAPEIVALISGKGYEPAVTPMRIVMPLILIIGYEQILIMQTLMPLKQDKAILRNSMIAAIVGVLLNLALVSRLQCVGSALVWISSECTLFVLSQITVTKAIGLRFPGMDFVKHTSCNLPLLAMLLAVDLVTESVVLRLAIGFVIMMAYGYVMNVSILKNQEIIKLLGDAKHYTRKLVGK